MKQEMQLRKTLQYLAILHAKTKQLYNAYPNALADHWGMDYPHLQALDDDQHHIVLKILWTMIALWHGKFSMMFLLTMNQLVESGGDLGKVAYESSRC